MHSSETNQGLQPLAQNVLSGEELESYLPEFELVESRGDVRNVAVTGPATANKEAVVNSWKARSGAGRWLTVSMPHFNGDASPISTSEIEETLINQIVCQMSLSKSPKSRFRPLMKRNRALDIAIAAVCAAFVALTIFLVWVAGLLPSSRPPMALCALGFVAWLGCIGFGVFHIVRSNAIGRLLARFKLKGGGIELAGGANDSRIERYMGDLVYLLDTNGHDFVVFEGLDTYRYLPLFERLRALNALVNAQRGEGRASMRFVYLVSDSLFEDPHERARFFDYIIPVIPFVDPANVLMQFRGGLSGVGIDVDGDFLADLSRFVDDPSILRDIVNEARHYKAGLLDADETSENDLERLIALLTYKALFPRDFDMLQNGRGYLNALLKSRSAIVEEMLSRNVKATAELAARLETAKAEGDAAAVTVIQDDIDALKREELELGRKTLAMLIDEMANPEPLFQNPPYREGLDAAHLRSVLASPYFPFVRFAVGRGWIDSTYERFLSNFYAESLAADDRGLIAAIAQGAPVDADRAVRNPFAIVSHLDPDAFTLKGARVFALLRHLLVYGPDDKLETFFAGIDHDDDIAWLLDYTESGSFEGSVFAVAERLLDDPIARILANDGIEPTRRRRFCHRVLAFGRDVLKTGRVYEAVRSVAHGDAGFLRVDCVTPMAIAEGLVAVDYRPYQLETRDCNRDLLQFVYDHGLYEPVATVVDNLVASLLETGPAIPGGFLVTRLFSLTGSAVRNNVAAEADAFVESLIEATPVKFDDSPEAVAWLLGLSALSPERALAYLRELSDDIAVDRIAEVGNYTYQGVLMDRNLVECTPVNILGYFKSAGCSVDEHLAALLEENSFPADFTMATTQEILGDESGFLKEVIKCGKLSDEKVGEITAAYRAQFNHFDITGISEARAESLIANGTIRITADNLNFVRQNYPGAARRFAETEPKAYLRLALGGRDGEVPECGFVRNEALDVFDMDEVDDEVKTALVSGFSEPVSLSADYPNELNAAIASTHFNPNNLALADELYAQGNNKLKRAIAEACAAHHAELAEQGVRLSMALLADVAWRMRAERGRMVRVIAQQLGGRDAERDPEPTRLEVRSVFERAGLDEYVELIDGPSAVIPDTLEDDELIAALGELGMAGKQTGKPDWQGLRRVNSKGYSRK